MKTLTRKHWIVFAILTLFQIAIMTVISGMLIPFLNIMLPLLLIHFFLKEPLTDYGLHFRKIHIQILSAVILASIIIFIAFCNSVTWAEFLFKIKYSSVYFPSFFLAFKYLLGTLIYAIIEEILFRGFYLTFFQKLFNNLFVSIFLSAVLFGLGHYPVNQNIQQVIFSSILGLIYGYLRLKEPENFTLFSLSIAHFLHNTFVAILTSSFM